LNNEACLALYRASSSALPPGFAPGFNLQTGLATGVIGTVVGWIMIWCIRFVFSKALGVEAMGLGDADLMMMAGAFLGWQPVAVAFFVGAILSLPVGIAFRLVKKQEAFPFGPGLALGILVTMMCWRWIGRRKSWAGTGRRGRACRK
jgi:leader peptidase (prepilin peptidase)/N-methyltransferase